MRRAAHCALTLLACIPWTLAAALFALVIGMALLLDRIQPDARMGNCWSFVLPRWWRQGGYLAIRWADPPMGWIPHAIWVRELPREAVTEQSVPIRRARRWWQAWQTLYFAFRVSRTERAHNARGE